MSIPVFFTLVLITAAIIYEQEVLAIICDSSFDAKLFRSQSFSIHKHYGIPSFIVRSRCSSNYFKRRTNYFFVAYTSTSLY